MTKWLTPCTFTMKPEGYCQNEWYQYDCCFQGIDRVVMGVDLTMF